MGKKFYPYRGWIAVKPDEMSTRTETGLYHTEKENHKFYTGTIASIGAPEISDQGDEIPIDVKMGDRVLVDRVPGYSEFAGFRLIRQKYIIAVVDKDAKIS